MASKARIEANKRFQKKAYFNVAIRLHKEYDKDIIAFLEVAPNKQGLIKGLLRTHIEKISK